MKTIKDTRTRVDIIFLSLVVVFLNVIFLSGTIPSNAMVVVATAMVSVPLLFRENFTIRKRLLKKCSLLFLFFFAVALIIFVKNGQITGDVGKSVYIRFSWLLVYLPLFLFLFSCPIIYIKKAVKLLLLINLFFWYLQFFLSYGTGNFLDFLEILGIRDQRGEAYIFKHLGIGFQIWRPTGLFHEPGTYSSVIIQILILDFLLGDKKLETRHKLTIVSLFLSLSAFGILLGTLFIFMHKVSSNDKKIITGNLLKKIGVYTFLVIVVVGVGAYSVARFSENERASGLEFRLVLVGKFLTQSLSNYALGNDLDDTVIQAGKTNHYDAFVEDLSFLFYMLYHFGVVITLLLIMFLKQCCAEKREFFLIALILFSKVNVASYFLWVYFIILVYRKAEYESKLFYAYPSEDEHQYWQEREHLDALDLK